MYYEFFPEIFVALQLEIERRHPLLIQRLQKHAGLGVEVILAETCHYCGYAIDALMDAEQLGALATILLKKLEQMTTKQIIPELSDPKEAWKFSQHPSNG